MPQILRLVIKYFSNFFSFLYKISVQITVLVVNVRLWDFFKIENSPTQIIKCLRAEVEEHSKGCQHSSILDDAISAFLSSTNPQKKGVELFLAFAKNDNQYSDTLAYSA